MKDLGIIAGSGAYPLLTAREARQAGVSRIVVAGFLGETSAEMKSLADAYSELRVGQLGKLISYFKSESVTQVIMAGQVAPSHLFDLRPDFTALILLARLKERNAESIFGAIGDLLAKEGIELLPATTYLEKHLATAGVCAGPKLKKRDHDDLTFGFKIAKEMSRLDVGQTVIVKNGTVLAVEAFEGTNAAIRRGGDLGKGGAIMVKVSKPNQDMRFDVPVIGAQTLRTAIESGVRVIGCEAGKTLLLESELLNQLAVERSVTVVGL